MSRQVRNALAVAAAAVMIAALCAGCSPKGPTYVEKGKDYDRAASLALLASVDPGELAKRPTSDGVGLRHTALAELRLRGKNASGVADLLTKTFPSDTTGVPVYIERGSFDGKPAVIVIEAIGPEVGHLNSKRIWFVGEQGEVLFAGSR